MTDVAQLARLAWAPASAYGRARAGRTTPRLVPVAEALLLAALAVLLVLALLPTGESVLRKTVSVGVYGPYGQLVPLALALFGVSAHLFARAIRTSLAGQTGLACACLVGVWGTASAVDAVVRTNRTGAHTWHGEVHVALALAGFGAQVVAALLLPALLHRRSGTWSAPALTTALLVVAACVLSVLQPDGLAGLGERSMFAASAVWMVVAVRLGRPRRPQGAPP